MKEKKIFTMEELREKILKVNAKQNKKAVAFKVLNEYNIWQELKGTQMTLEMLIDKFNTYFGIAAVELKVPRKQVFLENAKEYNRTYFCAYRLETDEEFEERINSIVIKAYRQQTVELAKVNKVQKRLEILEKEKANLLQQLETLNFQNETLR